MYYTLYKSPVGNITISSDGECLTGLWFVGQKYYKNPYNDCKFILKDDLEIFDNVKQWLDLYFIGEEPTLSGIKIKLKGSEFQLKVWSYLQKIPYGETITYGQIAKDIALDNNSTKVGAQAVGGAVGRNPISIIIPCHRVLGKGGNLCGYAGGLSVKEKLLKIEGIIV